MNETAAVESWAGRELRGTFAFLAVPAVFAILITLRDLRLPGVVLYGIAGAIALVLLIRSLSDPEWLLAVAVCYFPLSKEYVVPLGSGINGTNMLLGLMMISLVWVSQREGRPWLVSRPGSRTVAWLFFLTVLSGVTVILGPLGVGYLLGDMLQEFKGYLDQFVYFFLILNLIRDGRMARRLAVYMMLSGVLAVALGAQEMFETSGRATIEESRVSGPQSQPNDFGAFLVYSLAPLMGIFLVFLWRLRSWMLLPYFALAAKVLLATFSRGAYLGLGAAGLIAGYVKGKWFLLLGAILGAAVLISAPQLIPDALSDRMASTTRGDRYETEVDASAQGRLILWKASIVITLENPILGVGFKVFPLIKSEYTEEPVRETDNHNMYLFISSQMGIPALLCFVWLIFTAYRIGVQVYRGYPQSFAKAIGLGGAAMAAAFAVINLFGSRMTNLEVTCFFWTYLAIMSHLRAELDTEPESCPPPSGR